ncbi:DUF2911 domain-containing protein [Rapidithrix thailandica]|uniref:DUF2911 domain-containing protein n=1 Tax=Rapidithrix thailandica TaxID=413964 RepID=A0AAW9S7A0_9BACT
MKRTTMCKFISISICAFLFYAASYAQSITLPPSGENQKASVTQWMGLVKMNITYNSPDVTASNGEDRTGKIWGQLVPYGFANLGFGMSSEENPSPWRAGANENTTVYFSHDVEIEGKPLKAGKYALFMAPGEEEWTLIFSKNHSSWGSYFYNPEEDALRVTVKPKEVEFSEWLTYEFVDRGLDHCVAALKWENKMVPFEVNVPNINELYLGQIRDELRSSSGFNWMAWNQAANFCLQHDINLKEGLSWIDNAINAPYFGQENFANYNVKSQLLSKLGKEQEAEIVMNKAISHPTATVFQIHQYGRQLLNEGKGDKALAVFELNAKRHPDTWPVNMGLARGYSALGQYKKALKHAQMAYEKAPDELNKQTLQGAIDKLKQNQDFN